jgi:hypothetical protein
MIRHSHILATAALLAACAVPASAAGESPPPPSSVAGSTADKYQNLGSQDVKDAAEDPGRNESGAGPYVLERRYGSPDATDATRDLAPVQTGRYVLERGYGSPDATDATLDLAPVQVQAHGLGRAYGSPDAVDAARDLPPVQIPAPVVRVSDSAGGFDWGDAGIGAAGMLALFSIAAGSVLLVVGRKRRRGLRVATH